MKTALHKDQASRPRGKFKCTSKRVKKSASNSELAIALKMYAEFHRDMARTKTGMKTSRVPSESNSSKTSGGGISSSSGGISVNSGNKNPQHYPPHNVSICPVKRSVSSIEMGMPIA